MALSWLKSRSTPRADARDCPVCAASASRIRTIGRLEVTARIIFERSHYDLVECRSCDLIFISPQPSQTDLRRIYVDSTQFTDSVYTDPARVDAILEYMTSCLARILARRGRDLHDPVSTLEVGAGLAWMARVAKSLNPHSVTTAVDISPEAVDRCPWVDSYIEGDVFTSELGARGPYDVISLTHVIEHLIDPLQVISRCRDLLTDRGIILITAPHRPIGWIRGSRDISLWTSYSYNHVPAHIQYFSHKSMKTFARKVGCALDYWNAQGEGGQAFEAWLRQTR